MKTFRREGGHKGPNDQGEEVGIAQSRRFQFMLGEKRGDEEIPRLCRAIHCRMLGMGLTVLLGVSSTYGGGFCMGDSVRWKVAGFVCE